MPFGRGEAVASNGATPNPALLRMGQANNAFGQLAGRPGGGIRKVGAPIVAPLRFTLVARPLRCRIPSAILQEEPQDDS